MRQPPTLTLAIGRAYVVALAIVLFLALALGTIAAGVVVGRAIAARQNGLAPRPAYSAPSDSPARIDWSWASDDDSYFEQREQQRREECDRAWRQYQQDYTDYQTGQRQFRPMRPFC